MRAHGVTRAEDLAEASEVSVRTVYRAIAHLRASGLSIEVEAGVGYLLRPGFDPPVITFTFEQLDALAVGLAFVGRRATRRCPKRRGRCARSCRPRCPTPNLGGSGARLCGRRGPGDDAARAAARKPGVHRWLAVCGRCELRDGFRAFRMDRIASITETGDRFADDPDRNLRAYLAAKALSPSSARSSTTNSSSRVFGTPKRGSSSGNGRRSPVRR